MRHLPPPSPTAPASSCATDSRCWRTRYRDDRSLRYSGWKQRARRLRALSGSAAARAREPDAGSGAGAPAVDWRARGAAVVRVAVQSWNAQPRTLEMIWRASVGDRIIGALASDRVPRLRNAFERRPHATRAMGSDTIANDVALWFIVLASVRSMPGRRQPVPGRLPRQPAGFGRALFSRKSGVSRRSRVSAPMLTGFTPFCRHQRAY